VTGETKSSTEPWIESKGVQYAYAYDKGRQLGNRLGVGGIPHAYLINPLGRIVWEGHPGALDDGIIRKHLAGTLSRPMFEWPDSAKAVRRAFAGGKVAKAIEEARDLPEGGKELAAELEAYVHSASAGALKLYEEGEYMAAESSGALLVDRFADLPEAGELQAMLDRLEDDDPAQAVLAAQKRVAKLISGKIKKGAIKKLNEEFTEIANEFPGTAAERDAKRAKAVLAKH
jgi:hypothetical protein